MKPPMTKKPQDAAKLDEDAAELQEEAAGDHPMDKVKTLAYLLRNLDKKCFKDQQRSVCVLSCWSVGLFGL